ncbi:MAG TPA: hypothetical protein VJ570_04390 [Holophagaceae bacterium]|nr:hypothetical protein [Holophagaceae bacterium]
MSGLDPLQPLGPVLLEALRLVEGAPSLEASLAATPGAELQAVLAEVTDQGLLLMLADGRSLKAAGDLPYPPGTELTFRIQPQADGTTQLQPLRAAPPPPPALLAPLVQGEATALLQRLAAPDLPAPLAPLKALLERLPAPPPAASGAPPSLPSPLAPLAEALGLPPGLPEGPGREAVPPAVTQGRVPPEPTPGPPPAGSTAAVAPAAPPPTPPAAQLAAALITRGLSPEPAQALALLLTGEGPVRSEAPEARPRTAPDPSFAEAASAGSAPAQAPSASWPEPPPGPALPAAAGPSAAQVAVPEDRALLRAFGLPEHLLQALLPEGSDVRTPGRPTPTPAPPDGGPDADARLKQVLDRLPAPLAQRVLALLTLLPPAGQGQALPRQDPLAQLIRSLLPQLQAPAPETAARALGSTRAAGVAAELQPSEPATWGRWLKEVTSALSRPEASPTEAPFHRLQAREGTALFEVPLPWAPEPNTLELWAEREAPGPDRPESHRVLLALTMEGTGELRVALQSGPSGVQAQVVASPAVAARLETLLREELGEPAPFPLQVRAATELPPSPRALAGRGLQALG